MKPRQAMGDPCSCGECLQAGVSDRPSVIDTKTGEQLHGYHLKGWLTERDKFLTEFRRVAGVPREAP